LDQSEGIRMVQVQSSDSQLLQLHRESDSMGLDEVHLETRLPKSQEQFLRGSVLSFLSPIRDL